MVNLNITIDYLPTLQISLGIVALFEKIYDGEPILTVFSNIVQHHCFSDVTSVSQPDTMPLFRNNNWFQMTETGFGD